MTTTSLLYRFARAFPKMQQVPLHTTATNAVKMRFKSHIHTRCSATKINVTSSPSSAVHNGLAEHNYKPLWKSLANFATWPSPNCFPILFLYELGASELARCLESTQKGIASVKQNCHAYVVNGRTAMRQCPCMCRHFVKESHLLCSATTKTASYEEDNHCIGLQNAFCT